jgi:hypothetical protein
VFRFGVLFRVGCALGSVASPAAAYSAMLEWNAPTDCPGADALRHSVERLLGEPLEDGDGVRASATVTEEAGRFALTLSIQSSDKQGTRTVRAESCQSALDVAAFGIALALNPELELEPPPTLPPDSERQEPPPVVAPPLAPAPPTDRPPRPPAAVPPRDRSPDPSKTAPPPRQGTLWATVHAVVDSSLMPQPAFGLGAAVEAIVARRFSFGAGPAIFLPQEERLAGGGGGRFTFWSVQGYGCGTLGFRIDVCPLFHFGVLVGKGRGVEPPLTQVSHVYAPGATVRGAYPVSGSFEARAGLTALFPVDSDVFIVRAGEVHRIPRTSFQFFLGLSTRAL